MKGYAEVNVHNGLHADKNICAGGEYGKFEICIIIIPNIFLFWILNLIHVILYGKMMKTLPYYFSEKDSCGGDSGGPLVVSKKKGVREIFTVAGITSWGPILCGAQTGEYGIYTNVAYHNKWILDHLD